MIDLKTQLSYFKKVSKVLRQELGVAETTTLLAKAVYLINIGSNDYEVYLTEKSSVFTPEKYVDMVVGSLTAVIKVYVMYKLLTCTCIQAFYNQSYHSINQLKLILGDTQGGWEEIWGS